MPRASDRPHLAARALSGALAILATVALLAAGVGWLYLLYDARALSAGPVLTDALPLERLAGHGDQPLLRLVVAWLPTGLAVGVVLAVLTRLRRAPRALVAGAVTLAVLFLAGAAADAVTESDPVGAHLREQLDRGALWLAAGLVVVGALLTPSRSRAAGARRAGGADATRLGVRGPAGS